MDARIAYELPCTTEEGQGWMQRMDRTLELNECQEFTVCTAPLGKVGQHIQHDSVPILNIHGLDGCGTCTSKLPSEKAEVGVSFCIIAMIVWIMHARKIVNIVF